MKKILSIIIGSLLLVLLIAVFKFNFSDSDIYVKDKNNDFVSVNKIDDFSKQDEDYDEIYIYEEAVDNASDCTQYEQYDVQRKVCFFSCKTERECAEINKKIDIALDELGDEYADFAKNFVEFSGETDDLRKYSELEYKIEKGETFTVVSGVENSNHRKIAKWLSVISPDDFSDAYLNSLIFMADMKDDSAAFVVPDNYDEKRWNIFVNMKSFDEYGEKEMIFTLIHEFAHILTLNDTQINKDIEQDNCHTYYTQEGCTQKISYLNAFYQKFWQGIEFDAQVENPLDNYDNSPTSFVTEYAATNPGEDIAESFAAFVFRQKPKYSQSIAEQKLIFFYDYPELVKIRDHVRKGLKSFIRRRIVE